MIGTWQQNLSVQEAVILEKKTNKQKYQSVEFCAVRHNASVLTTQKIFVKEFCQVPFLLNPLVGNKNCNFLVFY